MVLHHLVEHHQYLAQKLLERLLVEQFLHADDKLVDAETTLIPDFDDERTRRTAKGRL